MKHAAYLLVSFVVVALLVSPAAAAELKVGDKAPDFKLAGSDGKVYAAQGPGWQKNGRHRVVSQSLHRRLHR